MRLLIIRHGESEADILKVHEGRADFNLTETGINQARLMAKWVATNYNIDKIYSSPLKRAYQTALILKEETNTKIIMEDDLMEFNNGLIAGLSFSEADKLYPKVDNLPIHASVYNQESKLDFRLRAERILSKIIYENNKEDTIAVVTHGGMITQLYRAFLQFPIVNNVFIKTSDTGIHEWIVTENERIIIYANKKHFP